MTGIFQQPQSFQQALIQIKNICHVIKQANWLITKEQFKALYKLNVCISKEVLPTTYDALKPIIEYLIFLNTGAQVTTGNIYVIDPGADTPCSYFVKLLNHLGDICANKLEQISQLSHHQMNIPEDHLSGCAA